MRKTKTGIAYEKLKARIAEGRFPRGAAVATGEIASMLQLGKAPVLAAVKILESEGFLRVVPRVGVVLHGVTLAQVRHINEVRLAVECAVLKEIARHASPGCLAAARAHVAEQAEALRADDAHAFAVADNAFHRCLYLESRNPEMIEIMRRLSDRLFGASLRLVMHPGRMDTTIAEHTAILDALDKRDAAAAEAAMRIHLENGKKLVV